METFLLQCEHIMAGTKSFSLNDISFSLPENGYAIVLGPTGCGKTMLLETLAGLRTVNSGKLLLQGKDITHIPPEKRGFGFAYQDSLLYPFLTVQENIFLGASFSGKRKDPGIRKRAFNLAEAMKISNLLQRTPRDLSGGERQRVSLVRSMLMSPKILLLDEPLSALDPQIRSALRELLQDMHSQEGMGVVHVTHDFTEALQLGSQIHIMRQGKIVQQGVPVDVFEHPTSLYTAQFLQKKNIVQGTITRDFGGFLRFKVDHEKLEIPLGDNNKIVEYQRGYLIVPPECITIHKEALLSYGQWPVTITKVLLREAYIEIVCFGCGTWHLNFSFKEWESLSLGVNDIISLSVQPDRVHFIVSASEV